jgi:3-oxoacyl-[acyl-carrier-protein] synthase II
VVRRAAGRRAAITGIGLVTALGQDVQAVWNALLAGTSGVSTLQRVDTGDLPVHIGGEVRDFDPNQLIEPKDSRLMDRFAQLALAAGLHALRDAGLAVGDGVEPHRVGVVIGTALGALASQVDNARVLDQDGVRQLSPYNVTMMLPNGATAQIAIRIGATGPTSATLSACASGADAIAYGCRVIQRGEADVMVCGGADAPLNRLGLAAFCAAGLLSTRGDEPARASRPFDADRQGCVLAEGAAVLVLEELAHARARGAAIYAELAGCGATTGDAEARCMSVALADAGVAPQAIAYVNAHAVGSRPGDAGEARAIRTAFGERAGGLACSATKSMTGHLLAGSAALEAVVTALAVRHDVVPPTINRERPDPECDLDCVAGQARRLPVDVALSNTFGMGGHNVSLVLRKP